MENIEILAKKEIKQKIVLDNQYKSWTEKIQSITNEFAISSEFNSKVALDHGIEHMERVANNVYQLLEECNFDEKTCKLGYIVKPSFDRRLLSIFIKDETNSTLYKCATIKCNKIIIGILARSNNFIKFHQSTCRKHS